MKAVNRYTSSEFHDWQRSSLPHGLVIQDLDAWAISVSDPDSFAPIALIELKRSSMHPEQWRPFDADRRNYASLLGLADAAGIPLYIVYFQMGVEIHDTTPLHAFHLTEAIPDYHGLRRVMTAERFASTFPHVLEVGVLA